MVNLNEVYNEDCLIGMKKLEAGSKRSQNLFKLNA